MSKTRINLLRDELIESKNILNLMNVVRVWVIFLLILLMISAFFSYQSSELETENRSLQTRNGQLSKQLDQYEALIENRRVDSKKVEQLNTLKFVFQNKKLIHRQLTDQTQVRLSGFANVMTELAEYHHPGISLEHVNIFNNSINIVGLAKNAETIPTWLTGFEGSQFMTNKTFNNFSITDDENGETQFMVTSNSRSEENK